MKIFFGKIRSFLVELLAVFVTLVFLSIIPLVFHTIYTQYSSKTHAVGEIKQNLIEISDSLPDSLKKISVIEQKIQHKLMTT